MKNSVAKLFILVVLGVLIFLTAFQKQHWDTDIFWALKSGEWIVNNLRVPASDPFSYTFGGSPWVDFTWGFQVLSIFFFKHFGGWFGLFILQFILSALTFLFLFTNLEVLSKRRLYLSAALVIAVFANSHTRFFIRPHLFEYLFVSLYLLLFTLYEKKGNPVYLYLLFPLQALWVNIHSSAILGIFLAGSYAAGGVIDELREKGFSLKLFSKDARRLVYVALLLPFPALLNPYGARLAVFPFLHQGADNTDALRHIGEWTRPALNELFFYIYPFPVDHFAFVLLVAGVALSVALNIRSLRSRDAFIIAGALYMAASHIRWVAGFGFFAAPIIASNLVSYFESRGERAVFKSASAALMVFLGAFLFYTVSVQFMDNKGVGVKRGLYPEATVGFMKKEGLRGNIYNDYDYGGYLIYNGYPEVKVFIDGRTPTVYSPYFYWKSRLASEPARWKRLVSEHGITMALVNANDRFCSMLRNDPEWAPVSFDDVSVLYLKRSGYREVVSRQGLSDLNPCSDDPRIKLPDDVATLKRIREELKRIIDSDTGRLSARPLRLLGLVDTKLGGDYIKEAADALKSALQIKKDAYTYYDYGVALGKLNMQKDAIEAFESSITLDRRFKEGYLGLGLASYDLKDYRKAIRYLNRYISIADDSSEFIAYKTLGLSYFETSDFGMAADYLKKAAYTADDPKELGVIYYYTGNSLFEAGMFEEGSLYYKKAIEADPGYRDVLKKLSENLKKLGRTEKASRISSVIEVRK